VGPEAVVLIISGPLSVMEALMPTDIEVILDLTGFGEGEFAIQPQIKAPDDVDIENIIPDSVPVLIEMRDSTSTQFR
jgi:hypothetical protein